MAEINLGVGGQLTTIDKAIDWTFWDLVGSSGMYDFETFMEDHSSDIWSLVDGE